MGAISQTMENTLQKNAVIKLICLHSSSTRATNTNKTSLPILKVISHDSPAWKWEKSSTMWTEDGAYKSHLAKFVLFRLIQSIIPNAFEES